MYISNYTLITFINLLILESSSLLTLGAVENRLSPSTFYIPQVLLAQIIHFLLVEIRSFLSGTLI
jgi:hypothetical protein